MNIEDEILFHQFQLGLDAQEFLNSPLGQMIQDKSRSELMSAFEVFLDVESTEEQLRTAQRSAVAARDGLRWFLEAVMAGNAAESQLKENDAEEFG